MSHSSACGRKLLIRPSSTYEAGRLNSLSVQIEARKKNDSVPAVTARQQCVRQVCRRWPTCIRHTGNTFVKPPDIARVAATSVLRTRYALSLHSPVEHLTCSTAVTLALLSVVRSPRRRERRPRLPLRASFPAIYLYCGTPHTVYCSEQSSLAVDKQ